MFGGTKIDKVGILMGSPPVGHVRVLLVGDSGVIFVYDPRQNSTKTGLQKWADEIAVNRTFSAPFASGGPYGLPVTYVVISNKADVGSKESESGSSGNLVDFAMHWVEKQGSP